MNDVDDIDGDLWKNLNWVLENTVVDCDFTFKFFFLISIFYIYLYTLYF